MSKKVLLKDIVIPAGTILDRAPHSIDYMDESHFEVIMGLSRDTTGRFIYCIDPDDPDIQEYFTDLKE